MTYELPQSYRERLAATESSSGVVPHPRATNTDTGPSQQVPAALPPKPIPLHAVPPTPPPPAQSQTSPDTARYRQLLDELRSHRIARQKLESRHRELLNELSQLQLRYASSGPPSKGVSLESAVPSTVPSASSPSGASLREIATPSNVSDPTRTHPAAIADAPSTSPPPSPPSPSKPSVPPPTTQSSSLPVRSPSASQSPPVPQSPSVPQSTSIAPPRPLAQSPSAAQSSVKPQSPPAGQSRSPSLPNFRHQPIPPLDLQPGAVEGDLHTANTRPAPPARDRSSEFRFLSRLKAQEQASRTQAAPNPLPSRRPQPRSLSKERLHRSHPQLQAFEELMEPFKEDPETDFGDLSEYESLYAKARDRYARNPGMPNWVWAIAAVLLLVGSFSLGFSIMQTLVIRDRAPVEQTQ